ncbi:peptide synthetase [Colletotrichum higginsianum]|uniref:Peptide synthetase n=1 Tax=Colletotrichum higginsianum (strain IMI 349063) TaxID=759273 RepID=H1VP08_COLHI|nr:peptide synthetase [Colletotrichum higginsianum]
MAPGVTNAGDYSLDFDRVKPPENAEERAKIRWKTSLHGCQPARFPSRPQTLTTVQQLTVEHRFSLLQSTEEGVDPSVLLLAAWAVVAGLYSNSSEVVFGAAVHGLGRSDDGATNGSSTGVIPLRVRLDGNPTVKMHLERVLATVTAATRHNHLGLQSVRHIDKQTNKACDFDTILAIGPTMPDTESPSHGLGPLDATMDLDTAASLAISCMPGQDHIGLLARCDNGARSQREVKKMLEQLAFVAQQLSDAVDSEPLAELTLIPPSDLARLWDWNKEVPRAEAGCVHHLIRERAEQAPESTAVCAWDGEFSYGALDRLSDQLAIEIIRRGVNAGDLVPLCFEKSAWTVVAILAVLKAGGAFVLLDSSHPVERLRTIVAQASSGLVLTSRACESLGRCLEKDVLVVCPDASVWHSDPQKQKHDLPQTAPESTMYVVFTSGSTGTPKGVVISHASFYSGLHHQLDRLGFKPGCRHYDFMAYSFDIAIHNTIATLAVGGCLCIPSESERKNNLRGSMLAMGATSTSLTPSVARLLGDDLPATLESLVLIGEAVTLADTKRIWNKTRLINSYGPAECTPYSTTNDQAAGPETAVRIGTGAGALTWVVHADDHNKLVPLGLVGELLLEGPILSQGYLDDPEKTAKAFIEDPTWLLQGSAQTKQPGRRGRLYKTGDLVRYNDDGSLTFVGRKDTQSKIRGQRIELAEVEYRLRESVPRLQQVAVEVVQPGGQAAFLAAFVVTGQEDDADADADDDYEAPTPRWSLVDDTTTTVITVPTATDELLKKHLPAYMVPTVYFSLPSLPLNRSGKVDRPRLREMGAGVSAQELSKAHESVSAVAATDMPPPSDHERRLRQLWANVLGINTASIHHTANFFRLGGDSLSAMSLVAEARDSGISLTVEDIFRHPDLGGLVEVSRDADAPSAGSSDVSFFSLLGTHDSSAVCSAIAELYGLDPACVEDVYPCTPLQEGLLALTSKGTQREDYILQAVMELADDVDLQRFQQSWNQTIEAVPILRTRIVEQGGHSGLVQVVLRGSVRWNTSNDLEAYLAEDKRTPMGLGTPLSRYAVVREATHTYFVWTIHHAAYDGTSVPLVREMVQQAYYEGEPRRHGGFNLFVRHLVSQSHFDMGQDTFWQSVFAGYDSTPFPPLPTDTREPNPQAVLKQRCSLAEAADLSVTAATVIRAAWALVLYYTDAQDDVVFGTTVSGRSAPIDGIQDIIGPTIATLPARIRIPDLNQTSVSRFLEQIQQQAAMAIPYEQTGLQNIRTFSREAEHACGFQTLLVVQPGDTYGDGDSSLGAWRDMPYMKVFSTYALTLSCYLGAGSDRVEVVANYDSDILQTWRLQKMLQLFGHLVEQLTSSSAGSTLSTLAPLTPADRTQLWAWNRTVPEAADGCAHDVIDAQSRTNPDVVAIDAWDGSMTYRELDQLAAELSYSLVSRRGIGPGSLVPLCFEKSKWAVVAILSVLRTGAAFVLMDPSQPEERLRSIVRQLDAGLILTSETSYLVSKRLVDESLGVVVVVEAELESLSEPNKRDSLPRVDPSSTMYVVFTSGSTGNPKGVVIPHSSFRAALHHQLPRMGFTSATRHYDFLSYAFDASIWNTVATLAAGGCLCIPSEHDRKNNLTRSVESLRATSVSLTPSVLGLLLLPDFPPSLQTVVLLGEAVTAEHARLFRGKKVAIVNAYGPAECTPNSVIGTSSSSSPEAASLIGTGSGAVTWVADIRDPSRLAPIGAVGELLLEGPIVGNGYLHDAEKTKASFIESPPWLLGGGSSSSSSAAAAAAPGRRGRLYKTGDLVRYEADGSLGYLGRKDTQVKIRGQRVELGEVEFHVRECVPSARQVAAEVVLVGEDRRPVLAAFVVHDEKQQEPMDGHEATLIRLQPECEADLARRLPSYMIPALYFALRDQLPLNTSGKLNRKKLRELGSGISVDDLQSLQSPSDRSDDEKPSTSTQLVLQELWAAALRIDPASSAIRLSDNFFRLGGDSITAMKLVAEARRRDVNISVSDVFRFPRLSSLAEVAELAELAELSIPRQPAGADDYVPFSLVGDVDVGALVEPYGLEASSVQDAYPCTALQEGLFTLTSKRPGDYIQQCVFELSDDVDLARFRSAWEQTVQSVPVLRSRIIMFGGRMLQVVLKKGLLEWALTDDLLQGYLEGDKLKTMELGDPLARFAIVGRRHFVWTLHHSVYDNDSLRMVRHVVARHYRGLSPKPYLGFHFFLRHISRQPEEEARSYWTAYLGDCETETFPHVGGVDGQQEVHADSSHARHIDLPTLPSSAVVTLATVIRAAWALTAHHQSGLEQRDVVFGATVSGRSAPMAGIDRVVGPTISTVPLRVKIPEGRTAISDFLGGVQDMGTGMIPFEQTGLAKIAKLSPETRRVCGFGTLLVVQPFEDDPDDDVYDDDGFLGTWKRQDNSEGQFSTYPFNIICTPMKGRVEVMVSYASHIVEPWRVENIIDHFGHVLQQLTDASMSHKTVSDLTVLSPGDVEKIWSWNSSSSSSLPRAVDRCIHDTIERVSQECPEAPAICSWDGDLTYGELDALSLRMSSLTCQSRHRGLLFATAAVAALAVSFRYTAASRRTNEQNQRSSNPHYVSVDRSGGGI